MQLLFQLVVWLSIWLSVQLPVRVPNWLLIQLIMDYQIVLVYKSNYWTNYQSSYQTNYQLIQLIINPRTDLVTKPMTDLVTHPGPKLITSLVQLFSMASNQMTCRPADWQIRDVPQASLMLHFWWTNPAKPTDQEYQQFNNKFGTQTNAYNLGQEGMLSINISFFSKFVQFNSFRWHAFYNPL